MGERCHKTALMRARRWTIDVVIDEPYQGVVSARLHRSLSRSACGVRAGNRQNM